jgi:small subunit ribosomal protein S6
VTRDYELGFILNPEVNEEQTRTILDRVQQAVTDRGGQVIRVNQWGRRRLAYPIERHRDGNYIFVDMVLTPESVLDLDRMLKVSEEVLRHLIKRREPKAVQKERQEYEIRAAAAQNAASATESQETAGRDAMVSPVSLAEGETGGEYEDGDVPPALDELPDEEEVADGETVEDDNAVQPTTE